VFKTIVNGIYTLRRKISAYCVKTLKKPVNLNFK
jgi:hypothetical protein